MRDANIVLRLFRAILDPPLRSYGNRAAPRAQFFATRLARASTSRQHGKHITFMSLGCAPQMEHPPDLIKCAHARQHHTFSVHVMRHVSYALGIYCWTQLLQQLAAPSLALCNQSIFGANSTPEEKLPFPREADHAITTPPRTHSSGGVLRTTYATS